MSYRFILLFMSEFDIMKVVIYEQLYVINHINFAGGIDGNKAIHEKSAKTRSGYGFKFCWRHFDWGIDFDVAHKLPSESCHAFYQYDIYSNIGSMRNGPCRCRYRHLLVSFW